MDRRCGRPPVCRGHGRVAHLVPAPPGLGRGERTRLHRAAPPAGRSAAGRGLHAREGMARAASRTLKIATFNVNGVNGRLPRLLEWLDEARPDIACLQEIKTGDATFPIDAIEAAGYGAVWHGQRAHHGVAILARGSAPVEVRRGLPGDDADGQARWLEADVRGLRVASVYLPNGNPQPGPRFDYKLAWFERLVAHARTLLASGRDTVLAGDFNVVP